MILSDNVRELILKMDVFMTKRGRDLSVRTDLVKAINMVTGEDSLDAIYVNEVDNFHIPDVVVLPLYNQQFSRFLMDGDMADTCPFGYTIEIHKRCFDEFTAEELTALIIHDILQNVQSTTAKERYLKAYNHAIDDYDADTVLDLFDDISSSEVAFMAFADICTRPFHVPVLEYDYLGTDEVLRTMGLAEVFESYLDKSQYETNRWVTRDSSVASPEARIETETRNDYRTVKTIISACFDRDIRHYYNMVRTAMPLVSLSHIFGTSSSAASLGFISRRRKFTKKNPVQIDNTPASVISESMSNIKSELEYRFQIDKIIAEIRYMETEGEREVILYKIKTTALKLHKKLAALTEQAERRPNDKHLREQINHVTGMINELDKLRKHAVDMNIKQKRYGVFISWPKGYEDPGPILDDSLYQL